jgi:DNA-binding transcriptional MerR regulator
VEGITIGTASARSGWSPRMLRYLEGSGLVVPRRTASGYRRYGLRELNQLRALGELRRGFGVELDELAFALRLRREPDLRAAVETWLAGTDVPASDSLAPAWVEWEQRKHERLLATRAA